MTESQSCPADTPDYMLAEMREQPGVLARIVAAAPGGVAALEGIDRLVFTGSGDSFCAAEIGAYACRAAGRDAMAIRPLELARYRHEALGPGAGLVAISASGRTRRVLEAAGVAAGQGARVIGITDAPDSPLSEVAHVSCFLHASPPTALERTDYTEAAARGYIGYHHDVPQTKTFTASVAWGIAIAEGGAGRSLRALPPLTEAVLDADGRGLQRAAALLARADDVVFVGSGSGRAVARYASYKLHEFTRGASVQEMEEYCHTHYFSTGPGTTVVFVVHDRWSATRAAEIAPVLNDDIGASTITLTAAPAAAPVNRGDAAALVVPVDVGGARDLAPVALAVAIQRLAHAYAHALGLSTSTFRGGVDTERYVAGSQKTIRDSAILSAEELGADEHQGGEGTS